jgi:hypothetical protein
MAGPLARGRDTDLRPALHDPHSPTCRQIATSETEVWRCQRLGRRRGPSPPSCLRGRAVGGVAFGGGEVGYEVDAAAAAEAVCARPAGEPVATGAAAQAVVANAAG